MTDGEDNSSRENGEARHNKTLKDISNDLGTMSIFLGANIDAAKTGGGLGFTKETSVQMTPTFEGASQCLRAVSNTLRRATTGSSNQSIDIDDSQQVNDDSQHVNGITPTTQSLVPPQMPFSRIPLRRY